MREQGYNVSEPCGASDVSRPGYYDWRARPPGDRGLGNAGIAGTIREIHTHKFKRSCGSPTPAGDLREMGYSCSENRVARIMRKEGIRAKFESPFRPKTTSADPPAKFSPNIRKDAQPPPRRGEQVASGICPFSKRESGGSSPLRSGYYVSTAEGCFYLPVAIDFFSKKVIGWALGDSMHAPLVADSIRKASRNFAGSALFNSDRGCQYTSAEIRSLIASLGLCQSMDEKGNCYDNDTCKSFFASLKAEAFPDGGRFQYKQHARLTIFGYREVLHNRGRRDSSLGNIPPIQFLKQHPLTQNQQPN